MPRAGKSPPLPACSDCHSDAHGRRGSGQAGSDAVAKIATRSRASGRPVIRWTGTTKRLSPCVGRTWPSPVTLCHRPLGIGFHGRPTWLRPTTPARPATRIPIWDRPTSIPRTPGCVSCHDQDHLARRSPSTTARPASPWRAGTRRPTVWPAIRDPNRAIGFSGRGPALRRLPRGCPPGPVRGQADTRRFGGRLRPCHVTVDWLAEKFDHDTRQPFRPGQGGHERVACAACHLPVEAGNDRLLHFKPLPVACKDCHVNVQAPRRG